MLRKSVVIAAVTVLSAIALFVVAGRRVGDLGGYVRATAGEAVDGLTGQLPDEVHDRKIANDVRIARQELIDHQVQMNLSENQIEQLKKGVRRLEASVARRKRLLAGVYPVLEDAIGNDKATVRFASTDFAMDDFQREIDALLALQDREERQLKIKTEALVRLVKTARDGEHMLAEMRQAFEGTEQEIAVLKSRREHAQVEAATLAMVTSVYADQGSATATMNSSVDRLTKQVLELEARNKAGRSLAPGFESERDSELNRTWVRLESLKAYHAEFEASDSVAKKGPAEAPKTAELVIRPDREAEGKPAVKE